jgi:hypothetical protein
MVTTSNPSRQNQSNMDDTQRNPIPSILTPPKTPKTQEQWKQYLQSKPSVPSGQSSIGKNLTSGGGSSGGGSKKSSGGGSSFINQQSVSPSVILEQKKEPVTPQPNRTLAGQTRSSIEEYNPQRYVTPYLSREQAGAGESTVTRLKNWFTTGQWKGEGFLVGQTNTGAKLRTTPTGTIIDTTSGILSTSTMEQRESVKGYLGGFQDTTIKENKFIRQEQKAATDVLEKNIIADLKTQQEGYQGLIDRGLLSVDVAEDTMKRNIGTAQLKFTTGQEDIFKDITENKLGTFREKESLGYFPAGARTINIAPVLQAGEIAAASFLAAPSFTATGINLGTKMVFGSMALGKTALLPGRWNQETTMGKIVDVGSIGLDVYFAKGMGKTYKNLLKETTLEAEMKSLSKQAYKDISFEVVGGGREGSFNMIGRRGTQFLSEEIKIGGIITKEGGFEFGVPVAKGGRTITGVIPDIMSGIGTKVPKSVFSSGEEFVYGIPKGMSVPFTEKLSFQMARTNYFPVSRTSAFTDLSAGWEKELSKGWKNNLVKIEYQTEMTKGQYGAWTTKLNDNTFFSRTGNLGIKFEEEKLLGEKFIKNVKIKDLFPGEPNVRKAWLINDWGRYNPSKKEILLQKGLKEKDLVETYLHERGHFNLRGTTNLDMKKIIGEDLSKKSSKEFYKLKYDKYLKSLGYKPNQYAEEFTVRTYEQYGKARLFYSKKFADNYMKTWIEKATPTKNLLTATNKIFNKVEGFQTFPPEKVVKAQLQGKQSFPTVLKTYGKIPEQLKLNVQLKDYVITKTIPKESLTFTYDVGGKNRLRQVSRSAFKNVQATQGGISAITSTVVKDTFKPSQFVPSEMKLGFGQVSKTATKFYPPSLLSGTRQTGRTVQQFQQSDYQFNRLSLGLRTGQSQFQGLVQTTRSSQGLRTMQTTGLRFKQETFQGTFTPLVTTTKPFGGFTPSNFDFFGGFAAAPFSFSDTGTKKKKKKGKKIKGKILPSFTAQAFNIVGKLPKGGAFGITPFQIRKIPKKGYGF